MMSALRLPGFYRSHFKPVFAVGWSARTFDAYDGTMTRWTELTPNPPLEKIDTRTLAAFKSMAADSYSAATVNKHLRHIHHLLEKAGPPGYRNRDALGLIDRARRR